MEYVLYFLKITASVLLNVIYFAMLARAILSWFDPMKEWGLSAFLHTLTEPVIMPVRALCEKMNWFEGVPIDIPFMITFILLGIFDLFLTLL